MAFHSVLSKCDQALAAYIILGGAGNSENTYTGKSSADKELPCTVCFSRSGVQEPPYSGNYIVKAQIDVKYSACSTRIDLNGVPDTEPHDSSDTRTAEIFDLFHLKDDASNGEVLAAEMTEAARTFTSHEFTVTNVEVGEIEQGQNEKGDVWIDTLNLEIYCRPSNESS